MGSLGRSAGMQPGVCRWGRYCRAPWAMTVTQLSCGPFKHACQFKPYSRLLWIIRCWPFFKYLEILTPLCHVVAYFSNTTAHTALTRSGTQLQTNPFAKVRKSEKYILESNINKPPSVPTSLQAAEDQYTLVVIQSTFSLSTRPNFRLVLRFNKIFNFPSGCTI